MAAVNGNLGHERAAVSPVLANGPLRPEPKGYGYEDFQTLKAKYEARKDYKPWDLEQTVRAAKLTRG